MIGWFKKKKSRKEQSETEKEPAVKQSPESTETPSSEQPHQGTGIFPDASESPALPVSEEREAVAAQDESQYKDSSDSVSLFQRLSHKLSRTRESFVSQMDSLFLGKKEIDADLLDDLEELLITADIGVKTATELLDYARTKVKRNELADPQALKAFIKEKLREYIAQACESAEIVMPASGPFVIMVVGVNGVGKTTTIGKIAHKFINSGQSVLLAAADTFRAAAVSQLQIWGERTGIDVVSKGAGADPSSVAFDALTRAVEEKYDVVLVDTAGRLHTQTNLMEELKKIKRVMGKKLDGAPHEVLLVIDATTGQNSLSQVKLFNEAIGVTGLALTKLDGTAKGGIIANICRDMNIPIRFIGIGEKVEDLRDFEPDEFINALFRHDT